MSPIALLATPANKAALERHYDRFLAKELAACTTCHQPSNLKSPSTLDEFPHNAFGVRLRAATGELKARGRKNDLSARLQHLAKEDADGDGVPNEVELLLGHNPGDRSNVPAKAMLKTAKSRQKEFAAFAASYRWQPFEKVQRPQVPRVKDRKWVRNPIDAFVAAEREKRGLTPRPVAGKEILLRRVYMDLIGLNPTPEEQRAFAADNSTDAYEKVVDKLLSDPRHGERWGRHWMDIWRYSDWAGWSGGNQVRDSKPHIWRWRDWVVESLNRDKGYDQMLVEMLAADELYPDDTNAVRATGYLVRNYKMLSREQWLEDTVKHTAQAFMGVTLGCAKCHDHMTDPISQAEYYRVRAVFEPHDVRTDRVPGELDLVKDGLVRAFDKELKAPTYFFIRGDERKPDTNRVMQPGVPRLLCGGGEGELTAQPVTLPRLVAFPDKREFVKRDLVAGHEKVIRQSREALEKARADDKTTADKLKELEIESQMAEAKHAALLAVLEAEELEDTGKKDSERWKEVAMIAVEKQRKQAIATAQLNLHRAQVAEREAKTKADSAANALNDAEAKAGEDAAESADIKEKKSASEKARKALEDATKGSGEASKALAEAEKAAAEPLNTAYKPRPSDTYPESSTGRRLAFARWLASENNPLTARVAMNHIWLRHFGRGIVPTPADFGRNGRPPSHPELLDWLASELRARGWSMKAMHRLIVTSSTYRMASTSDDGNSARDPDNVFLWRMPSRRIEAELIRDNLLWCAGDLDLSMGGPDIDHNLGLKSKRRSIYLRIAPEKEVEFLKIFDGPAVTECYERRPSVMPQQALALGNSELALAQARSLARRVIADMERATAVPRGTSTNVTTSKASESASDDARFIVAAYERILARKPTAAELGTCREFLGTAAKRSSHDRARENLALVLFNHNDFVTVR